MLEPNERQLLLDCLRPPDGYALDRAVGTTYSLDLYALLSVPVAFVFRLETDGSFSVDDLVTSAVRSVGDRADALETDVQL